MSSIACLGPLGTAEIYLDTCDHVGKHRNMEMLQMRPNDIMFTCYILHTPISFDVSPMATDIIYQPYKLYSDTSRWLSKACPLSTDKVSLPMVVTKPDGTMERRSKPCAIVWPWDMYNVLRRQVKRA